MNHLNSALFLTCNGMYCLQYYKHTLQPNNNERKEDNTCGINHVFSSSDFQSISVFVDFLFSCSSRSIHSFSLATGKNNFYSELCRNSHCWKLLCFAILFSSVIAILSHSSHVYSQQAWSISLAHPPTHKLTHTQCVAKGGL